jgi:hypothetical protein
MGCGKLRPRKRMCCRRRLYVKDSFGATAKKDVFCFPFVGIDKSFLFLLSIYYGADGKTSCKIRYDLI